MAEAYFVAIAERDRTHKIRLESGKRFTLTPGGCYVADEAFAADIRGSRACGVLYVEAESPKVEAERIAEAVAKLPEVEAERDALRDELARLKAEKAAQGGPVVPEPRGRLAARAREVPEPMAAGAGGA